MTRQHSTGDERGDNRGRESREVFVISVAAEITGMHAQTLRTYDRMGLVSPQRTQGGGRRYSRSDIDQLLEIQRLSHEEGVNLAGIKTIIEQQQELRAKDEELAEQGERLARVQQENTVLRGELAAAHAELQRLQTLVAGAGSGVGPGSADAAGNSGTASGFGGRPRGELVHVPRSTAVVLWEQRRRRKN